MLDGTVENVWTRWVDRTPPELRSTVCRFPRIVTRSPQNVSAKNTFYAVRGVSLYVCCACWEGGREELLDVNVARNRLCCNLLLYSESWPRKSSSCILEIIMRIAKQQCSLSSVFHCEDKRKIGSNKTKKKRKLELNITRNLQSITLSQATSL